MNGELRVHTSAGEIVAYSDAYPTYPSMSIMFKPLGSDYEIDLAYIEVKEYEEDFDNVHVFLFENTNTEDATRKFVINRHDALRALEEE